MGSNERSITQGNFEEVLKYLKSHRKVRDVLLSGGDPLLLENERLEEILSRLRALPHIELLRIGTRVPVTLPQRITGGLVRMLKKYHPLMISIHFTHPKEITDRVRRACGELADGGIPLGSQTVLLKGINDKPYIMKKLVQELLKIRVRPYYIYQCDLAMGTEHFRTSVATGIQIIEKLAGSHHRLCRPHLCRRRTRGRRKDSARAGLPGFKGQGKDCFEKLRREGF